MQISSSVKVSARYNELFIVDFAADNLAFFVLDVQEGYKENVSIICAEAAPVR